MLVQTQVIQSVTSNDKRLAEIARHVRMRLRRLADDIFYLGERLSEARELLGPAQWQEWVTRECGCSVRSAYRWMAVSRRLQWGDNLAKIPPSALLLLASPSVPDGAVLEVGRRLASGETLLLREVEEIVDKYHVLEGVSLGGQALLKEYGEERQIPRSGVTSLVAVSADAMQRGVVEIEGQDYPVAEMPDLPNTVRAAAASETRRRQEEHVADGVCYEVVVRRQEVEAFVTVGYRGTTNVTLNVLDVGDAFEQGETVYVTVEREARNGLN